MPGNAKPDRHNANRAVASTADENVFSSAEDFSPCLAPPLLLGQLAVLDIHRPVRVQHLRHLRGIAALSMDTDQDAARVQVGFVLLRSFLGDARTDQAADNPAPETACTRTGKRRRKRPGYERSRKATGGGHCRNTARGGDCGDNRAQRPADTRSYARAGGGFGTRIGCELTRASLVLHHNTDVILGIAQPLKVSDRAFGAGAVAKHSCD